MFYVWEENHCLFVWWQHYINKFHNTKNKWHFFMNCIVINPTNSTNVFLNAMNNINWFVSFISKLSKLLFQVSSFQLVLLTSFSSRSTKHDLVKTNLSFTLLYIFTVRKMELVEFREFNSPTDYKICKKAKKTNPTWYKLIVDVFIIFLYKVSFHLHNPLIF